MLSLMGPLDRELPVLIRAKLPNPILLVQDLIC
jgi:hypothetical protein